MKKLIVLVVLFVVVTTAVFASYLYWAKTTFVRREVKRRTGAEEVRVLEEMHTENLWYGKAEIDQQAGKQLLAKYEWKRDFENRVAIPGETIPDHLRDCSSCFYRIETNSHDRRYHPYNYTVYVLSSDMNVLQILEKY